MLVTFSDGTEAVLPLSVQIGQRGIVRKYVSSPAGTFGGWISNDELSIRHAVLLADYLTKRPGSVFWRLNPYDHLVFKASVRTTRDDETQALNLADGFDAACKGWTKGHGSAARKARREGVMVRQASTLDDWCAYYRAYEDSLRRWGEKVSAKYSWEIFREMCRLKSPYIKLWLAHYQEKVIAGALCFYAARHVVYWHGAALESYFHLRPVHLLMYEAIKDACEKGRCWFDFNPSGGHEGVKSFKKSFGAQELPCPYVQTTSAIERMATGLRTLMRVFPT